MSQKPSTVYTFQNHDYDLKISYGFAIKTLQPKFEIDLTNILSDDVLNHLLAEMYLNDALPLKLWRYYVGEHLGEEGVNDALDDLNPASMQQFKDTWWNAVCLFIGPLRGETLREILKEAPKLLKQRIQENLSQVNSDNGS